MASFYRVVAGGFIFRPVVFSPPHTFDGSGPFSKGAIRGAPPFVSLLTNKSGVILGAGDGGHPLIGSVITA
jgi:hypothetical protein